MYHSLIFWDGNSFYTQDEAQALNDPSLVGTPNGINTWNDWHIIPAEKPSIELPTFETHIDDLFGRSGAIDMTHKAYNGKIAYNDRVGSLRFYIDHDKEDWRELRKKIIEALHGKVIKMVLEDDLSYYYIGRFTLTEIASQPSYSQLVLSYQLDPYRYPIISDAILGQIYWDPFNFEIDYDFTVDPNYQGPTYSTEGVL